MFSWRGALVPGVEGAFTALPLDLGDSQPPQVRRASFAAASRRLGVPITVTRQVHGADVFWADDGASADGLADRTDVEADALITTHPGVAVAVRVADCVPILLAARDATVVAAVHAGRQGLLAGVIGCAVQAMRSVSAAPLVAWMGPHICADCYEVPDVLAEEVRATLGIAPTRTSWGTQSLDLGAAAVRQLRQADVGVLDGSACTFTSDRLPSHRRDASRARLAAIIWLGSWRGVLGRGADAG